MRPDKVHCQNAQAQEDEDKTGAGHAGNGENQPDDQHHDAAGNADHAFAMMDESFQLCHPTLNAVAAFDKDFMAGLAMEI